MKKIHYILGYSGLIPFVGLVGLLFTDLEHVQFALISYSTLIISFLAGTLWSASIHYSLSWLDALMSNVIMLLSWFLLFFYEQLITLFLVGLLLFIQFVFEYIKLKSFYPQQLLRLRAVLTFTASSSLILAYFFS